MQKITPLDDTIVAIATAAGQGGIGVVRLSGPQSVEIAGRVFLSKNKKKLSDLKSHQVYYGWIVKDSGQCSVISPPRRDRIVGRGDQKRRLTTDHRPLSTEIIDEVLLTIMRAPKSYTRQDVVEISCHGGAVAVRAILNIVLDCGARLADPGEFTKRAFLNGRIDLTQAEAVLDIIQAKTENFVRLSNHQLKGELSVELESIRGQLMSLYVELEAIVNFPEDDINARQKKKILNDIESTQNQVKKLLESSENGRILKDGIKIVICGRPNVGKSSLLNCLLKQPRAIVSHIAGTTRDTIEEAAQIKGIPFQLVDTAGILEPRDLIEEEAIKRSRMFIESSDLVLLVFDSNQELTSEDENLIKKISGKNCLAVLNKSDLLTMIDEIKVKELLPRSEIIKISTLQERSLGELEAAIVKNVWHGKLDTTEKFLISNVRHIQALKECASCLEEAGKSLQNDISLEFVSESIKLAVGFLDQITGRDIDQDLLDEIFSQFCIGK